MHALCLSTWCLVLAGALGAMACSSSVTGAGRDTRHDTGVTAATDATPNISDVAAVLGVDSRIDGGGANGGTIPMPAAGVTMCAGVACATGESCCLTTGHCY